MYDVVRIDCREAVEKTVGTWMAEKDAQADADWKNEHRWDTTTEYVVRPSTWVPKSPNENTAQPKVTPPPVRDGGNDERRDELPGESRYAGWLRDEPEEWDVAGGI